MPTIARGLRRLATAAVAAAPFLFATHVMAADGFVEKCVAFATAANDGKPEPNADKICPCIQGKLSESEQATVVATLDDIIAAAKAGKQPAEPAADKKAALQKFSEAGDTCSKGAK